MIQYMKSNYSSSNFDLRSVYYKSLLFPNDINVVTLRHNKKKFNI